MRASALMGKLCHGLYSYVWISCLLLSFPLVYFPELVQEQQNPNETELMREHLKLTSKSISS